MNHRHYKLVFSKIRGMLVAVSEAANSHNDGARGETMGTSSRSQGCGYAVKQSFAALLMAFQAFAPTIGNAQAIANDPNQAGSKPMVLAAGNGTPVINIISPNSQGVSLNQFSQYNIGAAGVVLNNSGGLNQTQLAGYVQGNPMLGNASASTIINQVTSANGSNINGFHEIAGNKANLVIANPNGILVNGAGFINAANVTLTTGTPKLSNGALSGFNVSQGIISVNGDGLNATNLDKITLISRAVQLNAGVWAKQADVILGANQVAVDNSGHPANITTQQGTGTAPQFALDVSQLGSMYAGQMRIIGTEAGLGINNGGQLISDAGDLTLDAQGQLSNTGKIQSANDTAIKTAGIDNSGHIGAINNLSLTSTQSVANSGKILAGSVQLDATAASNTGSIIQTGDQTLTLNATQLANSGTIGIAEDTSNPPVVDPTTGQATSSNTETPATDTGNTSNPEAGTTPITTNPVVLKAGHITANNILSNSGSITTSGALTVNASEAVSNSGAIRTAAPLVIQTQTLNNTTKGSIKSQNSANITATAVVHNQGSLQAQNLTVTAPTIDNNQGNLTGEQVLSLNASGHITNVEGSIAGNTLHLNTPQLDNTKGSISTNSDLTLDNARLDNSTGRISAKNLTLNNRSLTNTDGQLIASANLTSTADNIINSNGTIAAGTTLTVNANNSINNDKGLLQGQTTSISTASLTNTNNLNTGGIIGQETLNVTTTSDINNQGGLIAGNTSVVNAAHINNTKGSLQTGKTLTVKTGALNNTKGNISSQDKLTLTADNLINNNGNVATAANLALNVKQLNNATGTIIANQNALIQSNQLNNDASGLIQASHLNITAADLSNKDSGTTGGIIATKALDIAVSGNISNAKGYIGGNTATLQAAQLDNTQGQVNSNTDLNVTAGALNNTSGILGSAGTVSLSTVNLNNSTGLISSSKNNIGLKTNALINDGGQIIANASTTLAAKTISNAAGLIQGKNLSIATGTLNNTRSGNTGGLIGIDRLNITTTDRLNNQAGYLAGKQVTVHTASTDNSNAGSITATDTLNLTNTGALNNATGKITANGTTQIAASTVSNDSGTISSLADLTLNTGALSNSQGLIIGNKNTTLSATTVNNAKGLIQGRDLTLTATSLDNSDTATTGGVIATNTLKVSTTGDINNTSGYMGGTNATINGANINNGTGKIAATDLTLASSTINNVAGQISVSGNANISSGSLNNPNGLVYARQKATLNVAQIDNSNTIQDLSTATSPKGIQAQNLTIKGDTLNNSTGQIIGGNVSTTSATSLNNQGGQILGGNLSVSAPSLNNLSGKLLADHALDLTTQNYTHQGQVQGNKKTALHLTGDFVNQGTLSSGGDLSIDTTGNITNNTGSTLSATRTLALNGQNITNGTDATIIANHTQLKATDTLTNNGTIDGALTELRAKAVINNHKIYGGTFDGTGGVLIGADTLTNNTNAVIASRAGMNIGAAQITNQTGGLIQTQGDLSVGRNLGTAAEGYAVTGIADRLDNNSATIEVGGDVKQWDVAETLNKNTQFATEQGTSTTSLTQYYVVNGTEYRQGEALYVSAPAFKLGFSYGYNINGEIELNNVIKQTDFNTMAGFFDDDTNPKGFLPFGFIILPSSKYPFDKFTIPSEYYLKNPQQLELVNGVDYTISSPFTTHASYAIEGFSEISVDGFNTASPKIFNKGTENDIYNLYGWKDYSYLNLSMGNKFSNTDFSSTIGFEYITLAYYPKRVYKSTAITNDNVIHETEKNFNESFTYTSTNPIWQLFNITPPNSNAPDVSAPSYSTWVSENLNKYVSLNKKIVEFNEDVRSRSRYDYTVFVGNSTTNRPIVTSSSPAKIIVGGNMDLSGHITNDKSQMIVGGNLTGNANAIDNVAATTEVTSSFSGTIGVINTFNNIAGNWIDANPTPSIQTINLSVAEVKTNAGAQAVASAAGNTSNGASNVTVAGQNTASTSTNAGGQANASTLSNSTQPTHNGNNNEQTANIDGSPVTTFPTTDGKGIRTVAFNGLLPTNALFTTSSDPALDYLIVTDPQFTNKKQFLSSDYMLNQFDTDKTWKRIGDGFYEQKLINDQIITATGQRFIGDYSSNEAQYTALMNNGVAAGKAFGLSIGTALTAEQMGKLTTDIVWMVEQTVTLPDGSTRRVLVPKVYLAVNTIDLKGDGTIIAAKNNFLKVTGDVTNNGGTIAAFNAMDMSARNINNNGGVIGGNKASDITLRTTEDLNNIGGTIRGGNVDLRVGRNLNSITTTQTSSTGDMSNPLQRGYASTRTAIDQVANIQALDGNRTKTYIDKDGKEHTYVQNALNIKAGDANFKGASTTSAGNTLIDANNINVSTVDTGFAENVTYSWTGKNKRRSDRADTAEVGSNFTSTGDTTLIAKNDIRIHGSTIAADGDTALLGDTINIDAGRNTHSSRDETYTKKKGFLSSKSKHTINSNTADVSVGSTIIGNSSTVISTHDTNITGSTVFGTNGVDIGSIKGNVNIGASEDRFNEQSYSKEKKSGFGALGGFSFGTMSNEQGRTGDTIGHTGSTIAALKGNVNIQATQGTASIEGSTVNTLDGNINMLAKNIKITDVHNTATEDSYTKFKSTGISVSINSPILDAVNSATTIADQAGKAQGGTQVGALAVSGGLAGVVAYKQLTNMGKDIAALGQTPSVGKLLGALGSVSINLGTQKSESNSHSSESTSQGSSVTAGNGTVKLTATGAGTANDSKTALDQGSDILIQGSHVAGQTGTHLKADDDIIIKAGESTQTSHTSNKSSGGSIGVTIGGSGVTVNAGINAAKGKTNGSGTTYTAATVGDAGSATTFTSGDDTTLVGGQLIGQTVTGTVGGDLSMTSTQDTNRYTAKQTSASAGISVPLGAGAMSVSGSFSNENTKANTQTVNQVSGVFAGTGGYNLNVTGQTSLTGATIASTAPALNSLTTGSLITEDLHNSSDYKASSMGLSASWSGKETENVIGADGKPTGATQPKMVTNPKTGVTSQAQSGYNGYNAGLPSVMNAKGSTDSTTHAGISAGAVTITNETAQHAATGQTGAQTIAGLNRNVSADPLNNTGVANLYEQDKDKIATGFAIVKTLGQNTNAFMAEMAKDLDKKGAQPAIGEDGQAIMVSIKDKDGNVTQQPATIAQAVAAGFKPVGDTASGYISQNKAFGSGGYGSILLTGIVGAASGNVTGSGSALLQNTAINVLRQYGAQQIKGIADGFRPAGASTDDALSGSVRAALHAIAGCAGAAATGGDCTSAAAGSAATVALNNLIGADTTKMTAEQKQAYSNLMGTLVAGVTAGVGGDAAAAQLAAQVEVENNALSIPDRSNLSNARYRINAIDKKWQNRAVMTAADAAEYNADMATKAKWQSTVTELEAKDRSQSAWDVYGNTIKKAIGLGADFTPIIGDIKGFAEAETIGDYIFATIGVAPVVGDAIKEARSAYKAAKAAGDVKGMKNALEDAAQACTGIACFEAGTLIQTDKGFKAIETFVGGEMVWSRDDDSGAMGFKPVIATKVTNDQAIYRITVSNEHGKVETFGTTSEHPFWVKGYGWIKASLLQTGTELVDANDSTLVVTHTELTGEINTVYNIEVEDYHTYHIGELGVWVHNANCCGGGSNLPVPKSTTASNGLSYQSNGKHTLGSTGNNPRAGIEPANSLSLFGNSIIGGGKRYSVDSDGQVHQFTNANDGTWHWAGSTADIKNPLNPSTIPVSVKRALGVSVKGTWK